MSEKSESYRLDMLRRLKDRYHKAKPAEVLEAEKVIAKFREEEARDRKIIPRLESELPKPDLCPRCWFIDGHEMPLISIPADDPKHFDRMKCRECGYTEDRECK